jgi:Holliday junction resolvase RusA-like endonuclease
MTFASVLLDTPPSANKMWRKGIYGMHPSAEYKAWKTSACMEILASRKGQTFTAPVEIVLIMKRVHKLRDLDNCIKPVLDALQAGNLLENDNLVHRLYVRWAFESDLPSLNGREVRVEVRTCT